MSQSFLYTGRCDPPLIWPILFCVGLAVRRGATAWAAWVRCECLRWREARHLDSLLGLFQVPFHMVGVDGKGIAQVEAQQEVTW